MSRAIFLDVGAYSHPRPLDIVVHSRSGHQAERSARPVWNASGWAVDGPFVSLFYRVRRLTGSRFNSAPSSRSKSAISLKSL